MGLLFLFRKSWIRCCEQLANAADHDQIPGPAGAEVDLNGVKKSSNLYPLDEDLNRVGAAGHKDEDLGINSDGTNPGTEYLSPLNETGEE